MLFDFCFDLSFPPPNIFYFTKLFLSLSSEIIIMALNYFHYYYCHEYIFSNANIFQLIQILDYIIDYMHQNT